MKLGSASLATFAVVCLPAAMAHGAATVAVMPVQGVNLTAGQCDAVGVMFANAFARETNVVVATPLETKPVLAEVKTSLAAATRLGVFEYIELQAVQLGAKTNLRAIRFSREGREIFRSEVAASGLDDMASACARLARSLAWAQPIARGGDLVPELPLAPAPVVLLPSTGPKHYPAALGLQTGIIFPLASGKDFASMMSLQFTARIGPRGSFAEVGAGFVVPATAATGSGAIQMGGLFAQLGGGAFLSEGSIAPYLGGGVSPRIWIVDYPEVPDASGATCTIYGMAGVNFTRDYRARIFGELRVSQFVIALPSTESSSSYPTELSLQVGIGW
jgi:hypothetical protein